jgi:ABC-2 type transport system permease protein/oleandomycin transport system permease protein
MTTDQASVVETAGRPSTTVARSKVPLDFPKHSKLYWALADAWTVCWRNLLQVPRAPELLVFTTIQPVMFVLLFRYVFGGAISVPGGSYVNFLMAGIFVQTVAFGSITTGIGLADDLGKGIVDRFRSLPMARSAVLLGRTLSDLVRNTFTVVVMLLVGIGVGFRPHGTAGQYILAVLLLLLFSFAFSWIAATVGLVVGSVEAAQSGGFIWLFPLTFASSAFVTVTSMPGWLQAFAKHQPVTVTVDAIRGWTLGTPIGTSGWQALGWCLGILAVFMPLSVARYKRTASR